MRWILHPFPMKSPPITDYVHVDDHKHNTASANFLYSWWLDCIPKPHTGRVWFAQLNMIPLRHYIKDDTMAKPRKGKEPVANTSAEWRGFVNVDLRDDEWVIIDGEVADPSVNSRIPGHLDYLLELGKVTFNYTNGNVVCSLTILEGAQKGFTVSSFSDNLVEALLTTRLKVQNYLPEFEDLFKGGGSRRKRG